MNEFARGECDGDGCRASLPYFQWCKKCHTKEIAEEDGARGRAARRQHQGHDMNPSVRLVVAVVKLTLLIDRSQAHDAVHSAAAAVNDALDSDAFNHAHARRLLSAIDNHGLPGWTRAHWPMHSVETIRDELSRSPQ